MLDTLITSKTRKKLLLKFFLNTDSYTYLRNLEHELDESPNALRIELAKFEKADMLLSVQEGNKKMYSANTKHPLFTDIRNIVMKSVGFDQIIDKVISQIGDLDKVFVTGSFAKGVNSNIIDLLFVGNGIKQDYLVKLIEKVEIIIKKRIRYLIIKPQDLVKYVKVGDGELLLLWDMKK
ncbi:MAG: ArsR family transcriptional regulator [Bacteroidales bacterium]|nr:ArsR family transcriptional regulator [Bacteroidales bacterium]